jgi:hypothetical protein
MAMAMRICHIRIDMATAARISIIIIAIARMLQNHALAIAIAIAMMVKGPQNHAPGMLHTIIIITIIIIIIIIIDAIAALLISASRVTDMARAPHLLLLLRLSPSRPASLPYL